MRSRIKSAVEDSPGLHFRGLKREVDCSVSTLEYHLRNTEELEDRKIRSYRRVYPASVPREHHSALAAMNHEKRGRILWLIGPEEKVNFGELADRMDSSRSTVSHHLSVLSDDGLVSEEVRGRKKLFAVPETVESVMERYRTGLMRKMSENFTEMWE